MNEEIIELLKAGDSWKSTAMFLMGLGLGLMSAIVFGMLVLWFQRKSLKGVKREVK